jgi:MoaA/NifB/PqqE/SkfB family radical SAM enzyme
MLDKSHTANNFYNKNLKYSQLAFEKDNMLPHRYVLVLTNLCNLACTFCFQDRKKNPNRMDFNDWKKFINEIPNNSRITLTGGEPLVFKEFDELFKLCSEKAETNIVSNGLLLNEKKRNLFLSEKNFKVLGISIDTIGNINRDFKPGAWETLVKSIQDFKKERDEIGHQCAIDIKTVVLDENINDLFEIHKYCFEILGADTHSLQLLKGSEIQHSDLMFDDDSMYKKYSAEQYEKFDELINQLNQIREYNFKYKKRGYLHPNVIDLNSSTEIYLDDYNYLNNKDHDVKKFKTCLSPWTSVHVNVDGSLFPCMAIAMGNVKKQSLNEIFFSAKFKHFRNEIRDKKTLNGCNRCGWLKV